MRAILAYHHCDNVYTAQEGVDEWTPKWRRINSINYISDIPTSGDSTFYNFRATCYPLLQNLLFTLPDD
jgi:hypothetical protein